MKPKTIAFAAASLSLVALTPSLRAEPPTEHATAEDVASDPRFSGSIAYEVTTPNYGFFIHSKGFVFGLHGKDGKVVVNRLGEYILQRQLSDGTGTVKHEHAGWIHDEEVSADIQEEQDGADKVYKITVDSPKVQIRSRIICKTDGPVMEYEFEAKDFPPESNLSLVFALNFNQANLDRSEIKADSNPVTVYDSSDQPIQIEYGGDFKPYNKSGPAVVVQQTSMTFYPFTGLQPVPSGTVIPLTLTIGFGGN